MIYAKKLTKAQRTALQDYEDICGFEPLKQDELDNGKLSFDEAWSHNIQWLESVLAAVTNLNTGECNAEQDA